jgi:asparagine synthase (glutamine-hydrolysing)
VRWFGGHSGKGNGRLPVDAYLLWDRPALWVCGDWPDHHARAATSFDETEALVVIGPCSATDHELATLVGRDVPDSTVTKWAGAYTIIDARPDQVTIWTDPAGACPIYTVRDKGALIWGSSSRALASLTHAAVNEAWIVTFIANPRIETGDSAFSGVTMLPPGCRVVLTSGHVKELTQVWTPRPRRRSEAIDQLRATLTTGVQVRVERARPAVDLSGGMDSTTLAVLAAQHRPVMAVTVHPAGVTSGGDLNHARLTAAAHPSMRHVLLPLADEHLPYSNLNGLPATDEPAPSTVTWARLSAQLHLLADAAVNCHLTGDGGDTLFLPPPVYLADLARRGRWLRLAADVQSWARLRRISPWPLLSQAVRGDTPTHTTAAVPPWLTDRALCLSSKRSITIAMPNLPHHADRDLVARTRFTARTAHTEAQLADAFGIAMHNPYLDARILDIILGVPGWLRGSPHQYKPLLTAATAGLLPETVRQRAAKGTFAGDHHQGLRRNLDHVLELAEGKLAERGLITPERVRAEIRTAAAGLNIRWGHLQRVLAAEVWLRSMETATPVEWTRPETKVSAA